MMVYLAEYHYPYEGDELVGIYSTQEKAIEACETAYKAFEYDIPLEWKQSGANGQILRAETPSENSYNIYPIEVDA